MAQAKANLLNQLKSEVKYRENQTNLLYNLLIRTNRFIYPNLHAYGLSGTGKTYLVRSFIDTFSNLNSAMENEAGLSQVKKGPGRSKSMNIDRNATRISTRYYFMYFNCLDICHSSMTILFYEILVKIRNIIQAESSSCQTNEMDDLENFQTNLELNEGDELSASADFSNFLRQFRKYLKILTEVNSSNVNLFIAFDNADNMKFLNDSSNLLLTLSKLNEYVNNDLSLQSARQICITNLFISEIDWHSLISDCELMSKTEAPRPYIIFFDDYSKDQMCDILKGTARCLAEANINILLNESTVDRKLDYKSTKKFYADQIEFYAQIILDVFYPICKDLNEIQYMIQIYYDNLLNTVYLDSKLGNDLEMSEADKSDPYKYMMKVWNKMKPFLKQALSKIYLRQSMFNFSSSTDRLTKTEENVLTRQFEDLNIMSDPNRKPSSLAMKSDQDSFSQLPKIMKILLISAYICTHNPAKYDKKLFDYNSTVRSRKTKMTAQKHQQNEEQQRQAALKMQSFDVNRLLGIFFSICAENGYEQFLNLNHIQMNIQTLRTLNYLQQTNSSYSSLDESKFKCLLDLASIERVASSVNFNIKQYLAEFISL